MKRDNPVEESDFDKELLMMASWIDKIGVDNTATTRGAAKIKIGSALKRMLEYNPSLPVTGESEAIGFAEWACGLYLRIENDDEGNQWKEKLLGRYYTSKQLYNLYKKSKK